MAWRRDESCCDWQIGVSYGFDAAWQQYPIVKGAAAGALRELNCKHLIFLSPLGSTWGFWVMDQSTFWHVKPPFWNKDI